MNFKHGDAKVGQVTRLHSIWRGIKKRCNPSSKPYSNARYAGRGIELCDEWKDYGVFKEWALSNGYSDELSIERLDNDGNYSPDNCIWADKKTQARNRRTTRRIEIRGETKPLAEWLEITGITRSAYSMRLYRGQTPQKALGYEQPTL